jgi:hypothetical protein
MDVVAQQVGPETGSGPGRTQRRSGRRHVSALRVVRSQARNSPVGSDTADNPRHARPVCRASPASDGGCPGGFAGTIQRALDGLTYGMTALLTTARQPIPLHDAIVKAGGTSFLLIAARRQPDETKQLATSAAPLPIGYPCGLRPARITLVRSTPTRSSGSRT